MSYILSNLVILVSVHIFRKTESIVTLLNDLGTPMYNDDIVKYALSGLSEKYSHVAGIIAHRDPFPDLETMCSMVITMEIRINSMNALSRLDNFFISSMLWKRTVTKT